MASRRDQRFVETVEGETGARLNLVITGESGTMTRALPASGEVSLGRSEDCDVQIDDPRLSRKHVILRIGEHVEVIDLGSRNGTLLGKKRLPANTPERVAEGEAITLGSTLVVVQHLPSPQPRRIVSRATLEARAESERAAGAAFVMVSLRCKDGTRPSALEEALSAVSGPNDLVAVAARGEYEVLLVGVDSGDGFVERVTAELAGRGGSVIAAVRSAGSGSARPPAAHRDAFVPDGGALARLLPLVERVAAGTINVLVLGETGVGKEVLARAIHERSPRAKKPLLAINCAALSESLLESELFGYEKGAFTGALQRKAGLLEAARGGTVFLDEIGEMPLALQAKLLRVFEQREVLRVGAVRPEPIDVRFVAATHRDLAAEVAAGRFRQDFYFRLNGITLVLPPLRERKDEIAPLAQKFVAEAAARAGKPTPKLSGSALAALEAHSWPGNIRELRNVVERAVVLGAGGAIEPAHLTLEPAVRGRASTGDEKQRILDALEQCAGNQTKAAKLLGISLRTLVSRLDTYGIARPRK